MWGGSVRGGRKYHKKKEKKIRISNCTSGIPFVNKNSFSEINVCEKALSEFPEWILDYKGHFGGFSDSSPKSSGSDWIFIKLAKLNLCLRYESEICNHDFH